MLKNINILMGNHLISRIFDFDFFLPHFSLNDSCVTSRFGFSPSVVGGGNM